MRRILIVTDVTAGYIHGLIATLNVSFGTPATTDAALPLRNYSDYIRPLPKFEVCMPASWRWYDIFRTWSAPRLLRLLDGVRLVLHQVQERFPLTQRRAWKRRRWVQALRVI